MTLFRLPVLRLCFVIVNGQFCDLNMNKMTQNQLQTFKDFFLKTLTGNVPRLLNTLRIVTVYYDGNPCVFSSVLRVGSKVSGDVDNWAASGLSIGINESGSLRKFGFYKHSSKQIQGKTDKHHDTGLVFDGYIISDFKIACEKAIEAHKLFYGVHSTGGILL